MATQLNPDLMQQQQVPPLDPRKDKTQPIGPNNENLSEELQNELWALLMELERQDEIPRRFEIKDIVKRRLFWRNEQYWWYSDTQYTWNPPNIAPANLPDYEQPAFQNVTNIVRAYGESLQSVLSQNNTAAKFFPQSAADPDDVETAKNATKVVQLIHQQNDWQNRIDEATYFMCTDGFLGGYVRYVSDAERFGKDEHPIYAMQEVPISEPGVSCPECGFTDSGTTETMPTCPDCGQPTTDVPPETASVPQQVGVLNIPKGQEVVTVVPALQLKRSMWADNQEDFLYLTWITDVHRAKAKATYPQVANKLDSSGNAPGGATDSYERIARRLLYLGTGRHTGMVLEDLGTFRRAWLRPAAFELAKDDARKAALLQLYPDGAMTVWYNDVYCQSRNQSMDECWETMHTVDGEGQARPTLISQIMPVQEQLNDAINLLFEQVMNGVPEGFGDQNTIDFEARSKQVAAPGNFTPTDLQSGQDIRSKIFFSPAVEPSVALVGYIKQLLSDIPQFLTGAFPALFGGDTGSNDTASGISIQRNQALGRIGRAWRRLQLFCANLDGKAVGCFAKNMTQDKEIPQQSEAGGFKSDFVRVEDMQGKVIAYPEVDAQYPTLQSDTRGLILSLLTNANPLFMATTQTPENMEYTFDMLGLTDIEVPGADQRKKTNRDIEQMVQEQPQPGQPIPAQPPSPQNPQGTPEQPPQPVPSQVPDPLVDNLPVALETVQKWLRSDKGQETKQQNPQGFMNVYLYAKACEQIQKQQELQKSIAAQGLAGQGPAADLGGAEHLSAPKGGGGPQAAPPSGEGSQPSTA